MGVALAASPADGQAVTTTQDRVLTKLQDRLSKNPNNFSAIRDVGFKLYELKRFAEARPLLEQARTMRPREGVVALYAGLSAEEAKDYTAARAAYNDYLAVGRDRKNKAQVQARIVAISREELRQFAAAAVQNEQALQGQQVDGKTVAVLPFRCPCAGADSMYKPLERGLAELVVTDLSISRQLRVLERDRMQAIADEIRLSAAGSVDAQTATRAGKLIQAGSIVNGSINIAGQNLTLAGSVVQTADGRIAPEAPQATGLLNALFDAEKDFVLSTFRALNVTLLASEDALFRRRPTQNLQAFLAFSRGLIAQDAGRLDEAQALFESARSLDPGFGAALQRAQQAAQAQQVTTATVDQSVRASTEGQAVAAASTGTTSLVTTNTVLANVVADVNPTQTNNAQNNTSQSGGGGGGSGGGSGPPTTQNTVSQATGGD
jgi:tetratricopeptide (TPR) repeat protein